MIAAIACLTMLCLPQAGKDPARLDQSGVQWTFGFTSALETAQRDGRLLLLVPSSWEATDNGDFGQRLEPFHAGALCDERIRGLLNRRFVCVHFNIFEGRAAYDGDACEFVKRVKPEFGKPREVRPGVPIYSFGGSVLIMTPTGKLLFELDSHATVADVLGALRKVLKKSPKYDRPTPTEKGIAEPLERARLLFDLGDDKAARRALRKAEGDDARLLEAAIARRLGDWRAHAKLLKGIDTDRHGDAVHLERARALWDQGKFAQSIEALDQVGADSLRRGESLYWKGVALFLQQKQDDALAAWNSVIERRGQQPGPWVYRADWAICNVKQPMARPVGMDRFEPAPSPLGRSSYCGRRNPDLDGPKRR